MGDTVEVIAFVAFTVMTLGSALMVVSARNLFHAALYLLVSLFGTAGLFIILIAPFLAAIQVLVYMGAIGILIIFAVMLTRGMMKLDHIYNSQQIAGAITAVLLFIALALVLSPAVDELGIDELADLNADFTSIDNPPDVETETIEDIGLVIADRNGFVLPFEVASMLLTAAMIGAIVVAREDEA
jgi:NADH:ubiquinone oxidoreductase subunit 6 (subunit J)